MEAVTIVVPLPDSQKNITESAEKLLNKIGFNIRFIAYSKGFGYFDYNGYIDFCKNALEQHENVIMIFPQAKISQYLQNEAPELFKDVKTDLQKNCPSYYSEYILDQDGEIYDIPLGIRDNKTIRQLAVLVKNEYAEQYDKPINTADDYAMFLEWISSMTNGQGCCSRLDTNRDL